MAALTVMFVEADDSESAPQDESQAAAVDPEPGETSSATAVEILRKSRDTLLLRQSVSATLQEKVAIAGSRFQASGTYAAGEFPKLRLSFQVEVGDTTGSLLQVCDGQLLWTERRIRQRNQEKPSVNASRIVIDELLSALKDRRDVPEAVLIANLGMGGLPTLLAALERSMVFDKHKVAEHDGETYSVIQGRWNDDFRARLGGAGGKPLPAHVPDHVRIYFDQQTLFPTRVLYLKERASDTQLKTHQLLLSLEFSDVVFDGPVSEEQFRYTPPGGTQVENRTVKFIEMINAAEEQAGTAGETP